MPVQGPVSQYESARGREGWGGEGERGGWRRGGGRTLLFCEESYKHFASFVIIYAHNFDYYDGDDDHDHYRLQLT